MRALPQALEIIFKLQMKRNNEKIARKKNLSNSQNAFYFIFLLFGPFLFSKLLHFKQFKML
jgi:hypothetical protein